MSSILKEEAEREYIYVAVTFDQRRYLTARVQPNQHMQFNEIILFDFDLEHTLHPYNKVKFDSGLLEKMNQPLIFEVIHQRGKEAQVLGTKVLDWKCLVHERPKQIDAAVTALELDCGDQTDELGELRIELDVVPQMMDPEVYRRNRLKLIFQDSSYIDMALLDGHEEVDPVRLYIFKQYLAGVWENFRTMKAVQNPRSRLQNILGLPRATRNYELYADLHKDSEIEFENELVDDQWPDSTEQSIFVPPFHLLKPVLVKADLRHIIDSPTKALKLLSKIETRRQVTDRKERINALQSFTIDGLSALLKEDVLEIASAAPTWHGWSKI